MVVMKASMTAVMKVALMAVQLAASSVPHLAD